MKDGMGKLILYIFLLSLALIAFAYYAGVQTDASALSGAFNSGIQTLTGRNANNQFAAYPSGFSKVG
jgi:hypothetical protein